MSFLHILGMSVEFGSIIWIFFGILMGGYLIYFHFHYAGTPPGPWGLPLFGYFLFFSNKPYEDFDRLRKKYGSVFSIKIGSRYVVVLNDYEDIQAALVKQDAFSGKPLDGIPREIGDFKSVFVTDGKVSKAQRSFLLSSLREFGFGKKRMEEKIQEEAELLINEFIKNKAKPMEIKNMIQHGVTNIIACLLFGGRFHYHDEEIVKSLNILREMIVKHSNFSIFDAFPRLLSIIPLSLLGMNTVLSIKKQLYDFLDVQIKKHEETFDANNIRDVIDTYILKSQQMSKTEKNSSDNVFTTDYLRANAMLLFATGTETTSNTLIWALKILAVYPDIQKRVRKEIDQIIGHERPPTMGDKMKMPFTEATLLEVDRFVSLFPLTFYQRVTENTVLKGYKIPKNTLVFANLWNVHHNTATWKDPHQFNPDRFLDSDGKISKLRENLVQFSIGKRNCLGEPLAKMEIFLFVTCLLQKLTFSPANNDTDFETAIESPIRTLKSCVLSIKSRD